MADSSERLFDLHHVAVFRYLLRMTGRREVAEDLAQEVFLRALRGMNAYEDRGRERAWLISIARNLMVDGRRRSRGEPLLVTEDVAAVASGPELPLEIREAMARLPDDEREAFILRVVVGLGHEEIGHVVGATAASVRCRIYRARLALRSML